MRNPVLSIPSREFMVQQATLNMLHRIMPVTVKLDGVAKTARFVDMAWGDEIPEYYIAIAAEEFRKLQEKYS